MPLQDRTEELTTLREALQRAEAGEGGLVLVTGEPGIGKTRVTEALLIEAAERGFDIGAGAALADSTVLYGPWAEALRGIWLDQVFRDRRPPRLAGIYVVAEDGRILVKAERRDEELTPEGLADLGTAGRDVLREASFGEATARARERFRYTPGNRGIGMFPLRSGGLIAVTWGRANELLTEDLRLLAGRVDREVSGVAVATADGSAGLPDIVPMLRSLLDSGKYDGTEPAGDAQSRRMDVFESVLLGLRRQSRDKPLLIALDDLQFADSSSLGLLHYLARFVRQERILIAGTFRREQLGTFPGLEEVLHALRREGLVREISLGPLTAQDLRSVTISLLGHHRVPEEFIDLLVRNSGGNPLFLGELLNHFRETGVLVPDANRVLHVVAAVREITVPPRVGDLVGQRLRRLSQEERAVLDAAAVCGPRFTSVVLAKVVSEPELKVLRTLTAIARHPGLLRQEGEDWRFDHPLARETIERELPPDLKRLYHKTVAVALAEAGATLGEIGVHLAEAEDPRAVATLRGAAEGALQQGAPQEAARLLALAERRAGPEERHAIAELRLDALELAGRFAEADELLIAKQMAGAAPSWVAARRATLLEHRGKWPEALALLEKILGERPGDDTHRLRERKAFVLMRMGHYEEAAKFAAEALTEQADGAQKTRADLLHTLGICLYFLGRYPEALRTDGEVLKIRLELNDPNGIANTLNNMGLVEFATGAVAEASGYHEKARAIREATGDRYGLAFSLRNLCVVAEQQGQLTTALEHAERSLTLSEALDDPRGVAASHDNIGSVLVRLRRMQEALPHFEQAIRGGKLLGDWVILASAIANSVPAYVALGRSPEAHRMAAEACQITLDLGLQLEGARAERAVGIARAAEGAMDEAVERFAESVRTASKLKARLEEAETHRQWALVARRAGHPEEARQHLERAADLYGSCRLARRVVETRAAIESLGPAGAPG